MEPEKSNELNATNGMFAVVEQMNAGYEKFFESKPKTSGMRSDCYSNYKTCGTTSKNIPKRCADITDVVIKSENDSQPASSADSQNVVQQFFPRGDETKQCQRSNNGSGCSKYHSVKSEK